MIWRLLIIVTLLLFAGGCTEEEPYQPPQVVYRQDAIPADAVKQTPEMDVFPPILHASEWDAPVPMDGPVNTAGAEDSPFITPDGNMFFFFFTPDVRVPANQQLLDGVTGIWWCEWENERWSEPVRARLSEGLALDGAAFMQGAILWFASVREGNFGEIDFFTSQLDKYGWTNVTNAGARLNRDLDVGELHIAGDGADLYFGRQSETRDIWVSHHTGTTWGAPQKVERINTDDRFEDQPFISSDQSELWFTGWSRLGYPGPSVFRSMMTDSGWGEPEEIISQFAAEPTLDDDGNIYFVHHFYSSDMVMIEADIYVAWKR